jgi:hypothetical protein
MRSLDQTGLLRDGVACSRPRRLLGGRQRRPPAPRPLRRRPAGATAKTQQLAVLNHDTEAFRKPQVGAAARRARSTRCARSPVSAPCCRSSPPPPPTAPRWLQVLLPGRPNSHTGWIEASIVTQTATEWRIVVDLAARKVTVYYDGHVTRTFPAVVGKPSTPTPTGSFFVEETVPLGAASWRAVRAGAQRALRRARRVRGRPRADRAARHREHRRHPRNRSLTRLRAPGDRGHRLARRPHQLRRAGDDHRLSGGRERRAPAH